MISISLWPALICCLLNDEWSNKRYKKFGVVRSARLMEIDLAVLSIDRTHGKKMLILVW